MQRRRQNLKKNLINTECENSLINYNSKKLVSRKNLIIYCLSKIHQKYNERVNDKGWKQNIYQQILTLKRPSSDISVR